MGDAAIEFFAVPPGEDEAFLAAWAAQPRPGRTLYRALRDDVRPRFVSVQAGPREGVLLVVVGGLDAWDAALEVVSKRQGFVAASLLRDGDDRPVGVVHWSSPLMHARSVGAEGELLPGALYGYIK